MIIDPLATNITRRAHALVSKHLRRIETQALPGEVILVWLDSPEADRRVILLEPGYAAGVARTLGRTDNEVERLAVTELGARWVLALEGDFSVVFRLRKPRVRSRISSAVSP